jgi:cbb3-type cytochrome oxidase subunit 1
MMYFGALFYMLPRLWSARAGCGASGSGSSCAWAWNLMYLLGIIGLLTGHSQGREYGEFIWPIDILLLVIWAANIVNILAPVQIRTIRPIYVSVWFFIASPIWLAVDYAIGNVIWDPGQGLERTVGALTNSLSDAILNWWYAHNLFGLMADPDAARADVLHRPARHEHAALQLHAVADQLLGHGVLLHGRR